MLKLVNVRFRRQKRLVAADGSCYAKRTKLIGIVPEASVVNADIASGSVIYEVRIFFMSTFFVLC